MCVFRAIGWKHPRDWMCPFPRHISHSSGGLKVQYWKSHLLYFKQDPTQNLFLGFKARRTIICYSVWVAVKLFVTRFHCICPDYHHIAIVWWLQKRTLKLEHLMKKKIWSAAPFWKFPLQFRAQREIRGSRRNGRFNSEIFLTKASLSLLGNLKMESRAEKYCSSI